MLLWAFFKALQVQLGLSRNHALEQYVRNVLAIYTAGTNRTGVCLRTNAVTS